MKQDQHTQQSVAMLQGNRLKATSARVELLDIFYHAKKPVSANELFKLLKDSDVDKVTVYRNIDSLVELGILRQVRLNDRQAYYELVALGHHHHVVCKHCGKVKDMSKCGIPVINKEFLKLAGFAEITEHSLEFFGVCGPCAKK